MSEKPKRILHIVGTMNLGGQETFIMNLYRKIDRSKIQFDFVVHSKEKQFYEEEIKQLGGRIYKIDSMSKNLFCHMKTLYHILKDNRYAIIHRHTNSSIIWFDLLVAKMAKVQKIIVHSHSSSSKSRIIHKICRSIMNLFIDIRLACSKEAGEWLFGKKKFEVIPNGIDLKKYRFNEEKREELRKQMRIEGQFVIGHIGRFSSEKNQDFLIDILNRIKNKKKNVVLIFIGDGEEREKIQKKAIEYEVNNEVKFLGNRKNVFELLNIFDVFAFPSIYEGLPLTLLEVQANGLNAIISSQISNEVILTDLVEKLPLNNIEEWIDSILKKKRKENLEKYNQIMLQSRFNIDDVIKKMERVYE